MSVVTCVGWGCVMVSLICVCVCVQFSGCHIKKKSFVCLFIAQLLQKLQMLLKYLQGFDLIKSLLNLSIRLRRPVAVTSGVVCELKKKILTFL